MSDISDQKHISALSTRKGSSSCILAAWRSDAELWSETRYIETCRTWISSLYFFSIMIRSTKTSYLRIYSKIWMRWLNTRNIAPTPHWQVSNLMCSFCLKLLVPLRVSLTLKLNSWAKKLWRIKMAYLNWWR